ncbi:conserved hypothetical protein [Gammaproteobacteria bacterium]
MYHFCTYFDSNYLLRGLTLYRSLRATGVSFRYYVLCLDQPCHDLLSTLALPDLYPVQLASVEAWDGDLIVAKANRSRIEYYFTLSPVFPLYVLEHWHEVEIITYLDADLYFYGSPAALFKELSDQSVLIIEHRFPDYLEDKKKYGRFNVQYESFRRDEQGLACLRGWRNDCVAWCHDRLDGERYADQKYLDQWPRRYNRLVISQLKGAGLAPWNWARYPLSFAHGQFTVDGEELIFYHFHGVKILHPCFISHGLADFGIMPKKYRRPLYTGYIHALKDTAAWLAGKGIQPPSIKDRRIRGASLIRMDTLLEILRKLWLQIMLVC